MEEVVAMTIQVELSAETEARLAAQASARSMDVPAYAATLLERAANPAVYEVQDRANHTVRQRPAGRKSLAQLFADSPFKGLDVDFERDPDFGREVEL
jgi:hypothetical protein